VPELGSLGSVRGALSNECPYGEPSFQESFDWSDQSCQPLPTGFS
jgi:hypothetical protein